MPPFHAHVDQLGLPFGDDVRLLRGRDEGLVVEPDLVDDLHRRLGQLLGEPLDLVSTDNRRTVVSWRRLNDGMLRVRCLRSFALAEDEVVVALASVIRGAEAEARTDARAIVQAFVAGAAAERAGARRPRYAPPMGRHHDLRDIYTQQNVAHFDGSFQARIGWSLGPKGINRRSIRLGSWQPHHRLIKVHPVLDAANVPNYVLQFVVYHEMLHGALGGQERGRRNVFHTPEFRRQEAEHPEHGRAQGWINSHLEALLDY